MTMPPNTFETTRLLLRPIGIADVDPIFENYAHDDLVPRYMIWRPHANRSETEAYVAHCLATPAEVERTYMLVGGEDGAVRGCLALRQPAPYRLDCGYLLAQQGLMTEALTAVSDWALRQPSVFRISAVCDVDNIACAGVLEKAGFTREGLLRRWMMHPNISDEPRDCWSYSRTR